MRKLTIVSVLLAAAVTAWAAPGSTIYFKAADGTWQKLAATCDAARGVITFSLDPAKIKGGSTMIVLDLPKGIDLNDELAPVVTGSKLDGLALKDAPLLNLDWLAAHPQSLTISVSDANNPLAPTSLVVRVNGLLLTREQARLKFTDAGHRSARLELALGELLKTQNCFANTIEWHVSDLSPQRNTLTRVLRYDCLGEITESPTLVAQSSFPGYEDLKVLIDGKIMQPGETTYGSTWAAEEVPGDHWLVMAWPQEQELRGVEVFWAVYQGVYHAPQALLVQTWDGQAWVTQKSLKKLEPTRSTVIEFGPVKSTRLRLLQPDGMGHPVRPNIMWITEVKPLRTGE